MSKTSDAHQTMVRQSVLLAIGMHAFRGLHGQIVDRVELDGDLIYLNRLEGPWDKHVVCRCGGWVLGRHGNNRKQ
jgi:hypothetical protein